MIQQSTWVGDVLHSPVASTCASYQACRSSSPPLMSILRSAKSACAERTASRSKSGLKSKMLGGQGRGDCTEHDKQCRLRRGA